MEGKEMEQTIMATLPRYSWRGSWRGRRGRLSLSFLFFKDLSMFICWWGRHKHRSRRLKIHKEQDAIWSTETVEKRGKLSPVTEGGLVYRSQGKGWEVSLRIKRWGRMLRMVGGRWHPQISLATVTHLCGHCPPRDRDADLDQRVESFSLLSSLARRRTAFFQGMSSSTPASSWVTWPWEKDCPSTAGTTRPPHSERSSVTREQHLERNKWLPEWPEAILLLSWNDK